MSRPASPGLFRCVLQYGFEPSAADADPRLVETARRLSYLMQLDVLANDSYGSIASILLQEERSDSCRAGRGTEPPAESGALHHPGQAVAIVWGRSIARATRSWSRHTCVFCASTGRAALRRRALRRRSERSSAAPRGSLPTQSIAFAPRRLSAERLDRIDADWRQAARPYDRPDASGSARELPPPEALRLFRA